MTTNGEKVRFWKEVVVAYLELYRHHPVKNNKISQPKLAGNLTVIRTGSLQYTAMSSYLKCFFVLCVII